MNAADYIRLAEAIWKVLGPIAGEMLARGIAGSDPFQVLIDKRVEDIVPTTARMELTLAAAKASRAHAAK